MLYAKVNEYDFIELFRAMGREENFSITARRALYEYLMELSDSIGKPIELDVIGLCCEYYELPIDDAIIEYSDSINFDPDQYDNQEDRRVAFLDDLEDYTAIISCHRDEDGDEQILIQVF